MDAISHCVETFAVRGIIQCSADAIALDGLERGFNNIIKATMNGSGSRDPFRNDDDAFFAGGLGI